MRGGGALWSDADGPRHRAGRSATWCRSSGSLPDGQTVRACAGAAEDRRRRLDLAPGRDPVGEETKIYYVTDENLQAQYISMFRQNGLTAAVLTHVIDPHFISCLLYTSHQMDVVERLHRLGVHLILLWI